MNRLPIHSVPGYLHDLENRRPDNPYFCGSSYDVCHDVFCGVFCGAFYDVFYGVFDDDDDHRFLQKY